MSFANPHILWLLLVIPPAMVVFFWWAGRKREQLKTRFIQARLLPALVSGISVVRQRIRLACLVAAAAAMILALARPQWGFTWQEVKQRGVDIVVAVDTSKSMLAADITPTRLARAKLAALDLMKLARNDRLGLVAFAGNAFLQCPLTIDDVAFRQAVDALDVNTLPQGGTAIASAIDTALTAFKEGDNHKILVLMTDGEDHDSGAVAAAERAAQAGLRIFTIGIGTPEGELLRYRDPQGKDDYVRDEQGNVVKSHLDERLLQEIAGKTEGGFYLHLAGAKTVDTLYTEGLAKMPKSEHQEKMVKQYQERYHWPLGAAILLLLLEVLLPERARLSRRKAAARQVTRAVAAGLLLLAAHPLFGSPSSALRDYKSGNYEQSLKEYQELLKQKTDDPRLHFNAGAAAYRDGRFDEAAKQFNEALSTPDLKLQELAYYNRGNAQYYLGEQNPDPQKRIENWQKALKDYELSAKLNAQDADAKFNHEFVKKKLEELKQQQQQQQKQNNKQDQNQEQPDKQNQQQQQDQQKDQSRQSQDQQQPQQDQAQGKQDSPQQGQQQEQKQNEQQQAQSEAQKDQQQQPQQNQQAQKQQGKSDDKPGEGEGTYAEGQMTPEQARQLLDAQKGDERMLTLKPDGQPRDTSHPFRDW